MQKQRQVWKSMEKASKSNDKLSGSIKQNGKGIETH